jgi:heat shock protein HslJ/uncharacterized lipoprotein NlpE involved in copper resistance
MRNTLTKLTWLALIFSGFNRGQAQTSSQIATGDLGGTSWQLVKFQGSDEHVLTPDDGSKYTMAFDKSGGVSVRIDCNRGHGEWTSTGANQVQFGPLALTRAMCPSAPLNDRVVKDWQYFRSYLIKDGHLFLSLMADGGTYEYEATTSQDSASGADTGTGNTGAGETALQGLPATFTGKMPCADCPGIDYRLELRPDHTFSSHMAYEERNASFDDSGQWELAGNGKVLVLHGKNNATDKYQVRNPDTLRKLDNNGNEIVSSYNYDLKRVPQAEQK